MRKGPEPDVFREVRRYAKRTKLLPGTVEPASTWMRLLDMQSTRLRHAVRKRIPTSVRREARVAGALLAKIDDCFRKRRG